MMGGLATKSPQIAPLSVDQERSVTCLLPDEEIIPNDESVHSTVKVDDPTIKQSLQSESSDRLYSILD